MRRGIHSYCCLTIDRKHIRRVLADGEWLSLTQMVAELAKNIAPECAIRAYRVRMRRQTGRAVDLPSPTESLDHQIAVGMRYVVNQVAHRAKVDGVTEQQRINGEVYCRLTERTNGCDPKV